LAISLTGLAAQVVGFYNHAAGIFLDLQTIYKDEIPKESETRFRERVVNSIESLLMKGKALVPELQKEARKTWTDYLQPTS